MSIPIAFSSVLPPDMGPDARHEDAIDLLAESIRTVGLVSPMMLTSVTKDRYAIVPGEGIRRYWAIALLIAKRKLPATFEVRANVVEGVDADALEIASLACVLSRVDPHPAPLARRLAELCKRTRMPTKEAARMLGISEKRADRLVRAWNHLHPMILAAWQDGINGQTIPIERIFEWCSLTEEEQSRRFHKWAELEIVDEEADAEPPEREGSRGRKFEPPPTKPTSDRDRRPKVGEIRAKLRAIFVHGEPKTERDRGIVDALNWILGERMRL